ncbi:ribosome assembly factor SBDS [Candidatus Pacearchaeota archaeon]|nr:ribosome assembly factor SBDS [Candidatus Pacearchaeota archaeon]|tara:strand:+ start:4529 stop:5197 length:669 start_codon:yes stop_codon:yes gene_type:complete
MVDTTARVTKEGKHFEILVDLDEALKVRKGEGNVGVAVLSDAVFHNLKSGEHASDGDLKKIFGTADFSGVAEKIIKNGEVVLPTEYKSGEQDKKYKQVVDFLSKNAVSPSGTPYTSDRIMKALQEAHVQIKNKAIDLQINDIVEQLAKVLPVKIEMKKIKITIPAQHTGKAYGVINEFKESEEWLGNGDLVVVVNVPAGLVMDFYDKLNGVTHGSGLAEDVE